jgi:hypothetical protein
VDHLRRAAGDHPPGAEPPVKLAPSTGDFLFAALVTVLVFIAPDHLLTDASVGWHIKTGDFILSHRAFVRSDIFSYNQWGAPWFAWEWLADVVLALVHRAAGLYGVVLAASVVIALTFRKLLTALLVRQNHYFVSLGFLLLSFAASGIHALARPHLASWYLTLIFYLLFDDFQRERISARRLFMAVPLMTLWVNLHAGFLVGFVLAVSMVLGNAWEAAVGKDDREAARQRLRIFSGLTLALAAASMISPYGYRLHQHVFEFLTTSHFMDTVEEYSSPNFHVTDGKCLMALLILAMVCPAFSKLRFRAHEILVLGFSIYAALVASRSVPTSVLLLSIIVTPHASRWLELAAEGRPWLAAFNERSTANREAALERRSPALAILVVVFFAWAAAHQGRLGSHKLLRADFPAERFPLDGARAFLREHPEIDHLFLPDYFAGYVIYYFHPRIRCTIDDRMDFYGETIVRQYQALLSLRPGYEDTLDRWRVRYLLLPEKSGLASALRETPKWQLLFSDGDATVWRRRE